MDEAPRLLIPVFGHLYRPFRPITEPLIRLIAGGALAWHGQDILFGGIEGTARFFEENVGFEDGVVLAWVVGIARVRLRALSCARSRHAPRRRTDHRFSHCDNRHLSLGVRLHVG